MQDCRIPPSYCDVNAKCVSTGRKLKGSYGKKAYRCACKHGFIGNGITCVDARSGNTTHPKMILRSSIRDLITV